MNPILIVISVIIISIVFFATLGIVMFGVATLAKSSNGGGSSGGGSSGSGNGHTKEFTCSDVSSEKGVYCMSNNFETDKQPVGGLCYKVGTNSSNPMGWVQSMGSSASPTYNLCSGAPLCKTVGEKCGLSNITKLN